ncbi:MAG: aspartate racemase [Woeseia sp.]|nr:aspartate racemase [Woeseia sp.]|tara:strand:- start:567 stop:1295 length:729 start_codon:yes stop_codon:yes gene_type:complete
MSKKAKKIVGVMGGMGPAATIDFMSKVMAQIDSARDQDHLHMIVDQDPTVPNRQVALASGLDDVTPRITAMAKRLEESGAAFLVMVCNTAHAFLTGVDAEINIPLINIIEESVGEIDRLYPITSAVGVMATDGCLSSGLYQEAIQASGRKAVIPDDKNLDELMRLIHSIKAGKENGDISNAMAGVAQSLVARGAEVIIAGCTEIPIVFDGHSFDVPVISSTDVLVDRTLALAMGTEPLQGSK